jgi:hypothetical protein
MIEVGVRDAVRSRKCPKPYVPASPTTITIEIGTADHGGAVTGRAGVEIVEPLKVLSRGRTGSRRGIRLGMVGDTERVDMQEPNSISLIVCGTGRTGVSENELRLMGLPESLISKARNIAKPGFCVLIDWSQSP